MRHPTGGGTANRSESASRRVSVALATTVVAATLALGLAAGLGAAVPADGTGVAADVGSDATAAQEDLDEGDRAQVDDSTESPYSAVVQIRRDTDRRLSTFDSLGSGVLVSDRHVVTAAHVVYDEETERQLSTSDLAVAPGQNDQVDHDGLPYGTAQVVSVNAEANPYTTGISDAVAEWLSLVGVDATGKCHACDFAILTLDRPVGAFSGTLEPRTTGGFEGTVLTAGYPQDTPSATQWLAKGQYDQTVWPDVVEIRIPVTHGNSGGPVWSDDEDGSFFGIMTGTWPHVTNSLATPINEDRLDDIDQQIQADGAPTARADLHVVEGYGWVGEYGPTLYPADPTVTGDTGYLEPAVAVYNNAPYVAGDANQDVPVAFYLADSDVENPSVEDMEAELCRVELDPIYPYETGVASCIATDFSHLDLEFGGTDEFQFDVYAVVDPDDEIDEYTDERRAPTQIGGVGIDSQPDWDLEVTAPQSAEATESFDVTAEVTNGASYRNSTTVSVDGGEYADCGGDTDVALDGGQTQSVTFECTAAEVHAEDTTVTVTAADVERTRSVEILAPEDLRGTFHPHGLTITHPYGEDADPIEGQLSEALDGGTINVSVDVQNVGDYAGTRELWFTMYVESENEYVECVGDEWTPIVELDQHEEVTLTTDCRLPDGVSSSSDGLEVSATVGTWNGDATSTRSFLVYGPTSPDFQLPSIAAPSETDAGEAVEIYSEAFNRQGPGTERVSVTVGDEVLFDRDVYMDYEGNREFEWEWTPDPGTRGEHQIVYESESDRETKTITVDPQPVPVDASLPTFLETGEQFAVDVNVTNEGDGTDVHTVVVTAGETTVTERDVTVEPGDQRSLALRGNLSSSLAGQRTTLAVASDTHQTNVSARIVADCMEVDSRTVCDVNGDGLYRDFNADGAVSQTDVSEFFGVQHRSAYKRDEFDFNENGDVGHDDVITLFEYVSTQ